ncbi:MarR family transcriptional regulator [Nocardia sp. CDC153]|uniref:MarR family winged helix-turn-helix transcriptional regulator n=1 Tax=Nocardia sp. CDC153 TaxID=3112167 RepID=UPI002DBA2A63|nr:MarR family transcriptional regulator [Nocardia sp. CDC153]MEC3954668.1 MarR family transcriptional regulator [Nocardia sp. CDC153]
MPVEERLGTFIKRAEQALMGAKNAALKPAGVTIPQYAALYVLSENPGISAAELARRCGVTAPTMNTVLGNLRDRGLIERTPHAWHRNVLETRLTDAGRKVMREADSRAVPVERALAAEFTAAELASLMDMLTRAATVLDSVRPDNT